MMMGEAEVTESVIAVITAACYVVLSSPVELSDPRLDYELRQVDRDTWQELLTALASLESKLRPRC